MRVFLAGATGVIGIRLVPLLIAAGHQVVGMTRSPGKSSSLRSLGAEAVVGSVFDTGWLERVVTEAAPDVLVNQLTDLPDSPEDLPGHHQANARIRREGADNLIAAGQSAGTRHWVSQSVAWPLPGESGAAASHLEKATLAVGGTVVRYGRLYGPGTYFPDSKPVHPRVHVDDAAARTVPLLDAGPVVVEIVDPT